MDMDDSWCHKKKNIMHVLGGPQILQQSNQSDRQMCQKPMDVVVQATQFLESLRAMGGWKLWGQVGKCIESQHQLWFDGQLMVMDLQMTFLLLSQISEVS